VSLQAVQLLPEHQVWPGQRLHITASHDTYAISYAIAAHTAATPQQQINSNQPANCTSTNSMHQSVLCSASAGADTHKHTMASACRASAVPAAPRPTGVAFVDPLWKSAYDAVSALQASLAKAATQDPLEYRRLVSAALLLAMRPWGAEPAIARTGSCAVAGGKAAGGSEAVQVSAAKVLEGGGQPDTLGKALHSSTAGGGRHLAADPHHAAALLVRLMG
jgi:hypothetical protein